MLYLRNGTWHCDCDRELSLEELARGQCSDCRAQGITPPTPRALELVRTGRVLDMRDERWQTACPR